MADILRNFEVVTDWTGAWTRTVATLWITYAWADNTAGDIDFIAQELQAVGLKIKLDRWSLKAGSRLWDQIADFIQSPTECDAWLLVATQASLCSEPCREEFAYALDRALKSRGGTFPVIALFPSRVESSFIPAGIKTRLYVSLSDPDWKERIAAAAENRDLSVARPQVEPYHLAIHPPDALRTDYLIEVRPRAGSWSPFVAAVPSAEKDCLRLILHNAAGRLPSGGVLMNCGEGEKDGWAFRFAGNEATPAMSYFLHCKKLPSKILFGADGGPQFIVENPSAA